MFSQLTQNKIMHYVYCLNDPDSGETFYIGKGKDNRVFSHASGVFENDKNIEKIEKIKDIIRQGNKVDHWIIRHGLTEKEAFEVEAALIDFVGLDSLTNSVKGHSVSRGKISCAELDIQMGARKIDVRHNLMVIKINAKYRSDLNEMELYKETRKWWVAQQEKAEKAEYILSVNNGIVRGVFKATSWLKAEDSNRIAFEGEVAPDTIKDLYLHTTIKDYIKKGSASLIQYLYIDPTNLEIVESEEAINSIDKHFEIVEKVILIKINASYHEGMTREAIYQATKGDWKLSLAKAKQAELVFSIINGTILEVYEIEKWVQSKTWGRIAFEGCLASENIRNKYVNGSVSHLYSKGEVNPCKYINI